MSGFEDCGVCHGRGWRWEAIPPSREELAAALTVAAQPSEPADFRAARYACPCTWKGRPATWDDLPPWN